MYIKGRLLERVASLNKSTLKRPSLYYYLSQYIVLMNDNSNK